MKNIFLGTLFTLSLLFLGDFNPAIASGTEVSEELTKSEIAERLIEIDDKYGIGEPVSDEDAAFLMTYGTVPTQTKTRGLFDYEFYFNDTNYASSATVKVWGYCEVKLTNPLKNSYNCNGYGSSTVGSVTFSVEHTGWGFLGASVLGKVYERTFSSTKNKYASQDNVGDTYAAGVVVATTVLRASAVVDGKVVQAWESH